MRRSRCSSTVAVREKQQSSGAASPKAGPCADGRCLARTGDLLLVRREQLLRCTAVCRSDRSTSDLPHAAAALCCGLALPQRFQMIAHGWDSRSLSHKRANAVLYGSTCGIDRMRERCDRRRRRPMKRIVVDHFGGPEVLRVVEEDDPRPGPGEVRVRVLAAGVSFTDAQLRAGTYLGGPKPPFTPGYELVGVVEALGPGCARLQRGRSRRRADGVGRRRGARLRAGEVRGRGARGPRPGGGREPRSSRT